ncbi:MAG TPA: molybdopterin-dependent oxidoreductase [Gaiellales bacterium]
MADSAVLTTCPRDCYDACGILVTVRDGEIRSVRGDPNHPVSRGRLCRKCSIGYNGVFLDADERLTTPLRRVGPKGEGRFEPFGWDEAIALITGRWREIAAASGAEAILNAHYTGTCSLIAGSFGARFLRRLGATEIDPDSVCNKAGHVALDYMYGTSVTGFDPRTARDTSCILVWGANPSASAPHMHDQWLQESPGSLIVVDPIRTPTAEIADVHLQPFPGSDAALAFAMLHVIARDGLADRDLLRDHTVGWDELEPQIAPCTPEWGEHATGVSAELIEQAARAYGAGPSLLWIGQGLQRQPTGGNVMRAVALLPAVSGNLAKPGAGFLYLNDQLEIDGDWLEAPQLGTPPEPISHMDLAETLEHPARARSLLCWNINIAASNPQQSRLRAALEREDLFTVVIDLFSTDTCDYADVVLPAASFLEFDDLVASYFDLTLSAQVRAAGPPGDALPNQEIFRRLAAGMGFDEPELHETDREMIDAMLKQSGVVGSFEQLASVGTVPLSAEPVIQFADMRFDTPSGRIEIASAAAEADGHPRLPQPRSDPRPAGGRLRLLSPASPWLMNDSFANDRKIARRIGEATVTLHPADAADRGIAAGDRVRMHNEVGELELLAAVSDMVPAGVVYSPKGRWPKREAEAANVNVLNDGRKADFGGSTAVHAVEVALDRV